MIMKILSTILLTLLIVLGACTSPQVSPDPFVRVSNGRLTVNGKPYYYIENWSFWWDLKITFLTTFGRRTYRNAG
jgi:mannan endo-1,4-beta-mannosidase